MKVKKENWKRYISCGMLQIIVVLSLVISVFSDAKAQTHTKAAANCVMHSEYLKATSKTKNAVSCVDCYCQVCGDKKEKEKLAKQKAEEAADKQKQAVPTKKITTAATKTKSNEVTLVAPKQVSNNFKATTQKEVGSNTKNLPYWLPIKDKETNLLGYKEKNSPDAEWKIKPLFVEAPLRQTSAFHEGINYAIVTISKGDRTAGVCGAEMFLHEQAVIDRKGNIVLTSGKGHEFYFFEDKKLPFVFKAVNKGAAYACSFEIYNIEKKIMVCSIPGNFKTQEGNQVIFFNNPKLSVNSFSTSYLKESVIESLKDIYIDKAFDFGELYYKKSIGWDDPKKNSGAWTAYLMNKRGDFKIIQGEGPIYLK